MEFENFIDIGIGIISGALLTVPSLWLYQKIRLKTFRIVSRKIIEEAEKNAQNLNRTAENDRKRKELEQERELENFRIRERKKLHEIEERLKQREDKLENRIASVEKKILDTEKREAVILQKKELLEEEKKAHEQMKSELITRLEKLSGLSATEAKELLLEKTKAEVRAEAANFIRKTLKEAEETAEIEAVKIIATGINRLAVSCVSETTINTVALPNEDMKGRIIGREGKNIRAIERATGVNVIIDETPNAVVLSGFDPLRLHIAKLAMTDLVTDGRIHPTRIEEAVEKAQLQIKKQIKYYGEDAAMRAGVINLQPELVTLLGKLKFRHSYGQNVLDHSLEVSHIMGLMAGELGIDVERAKRIGLLHDMGKAVSHEMEGTHALIGYDLALKYGETKEIANGIGCHHHEMEAITIEGSLCCSADAISAARLGARIEAVGEYTKRLKKLEEIAYKFPVVEKAFALQAGRELRIFVLPDKIDDDGVIHLARDLTKEIEKHLTYGTVKVSVTREKNVVQYAG